MSVCKLNSLEHFIFRILNRNEIFRRTQKSSRLLRFFFVKSFSCVQIDPISTHKSESRPLYVSRLYDKTLTKKINTFFIQTENFGRFKTSVIPADTSTSFLKTRILLFLVPHPSGIPKKFKSGYQVFT